VDPGAILIILSIVIGVVLYLISTGTADPAP
jgi:hypothetical protein